MVTRRQFVQAAALTAATPFLAASPPRAYAFSQSDNLQKFIQPLRRPGAGIPLATPDMGPPQPWWQAGATHYTIDIGQFEDQLHPALPNPTRLWGFGQGAASSFRHLGGVIAAARGTAVQVTFRNNLPATHILPVDTTIPGAELAPNRTSVHVHGGLVPWVSDGGPHAWWAPDGDHGLSWTNALGNPNLNEFEYYYPNNQGARLVWYHDHALGITRLNAYAGIASGYVITDAYETTLTGTPFNLPGPLAARTIYLIFQDKTFVSANIAALDPTWPLLMPNSRPGDLWYPHVYEPARWELAPGGAPPNPSAVAEAFGDTILVNGTVYPFLEVEQRQYRLRMLNACNARFLNPRLVFAQGAALPASAEPNPNAAGPAFIQFGTEGGFLPAPVMVNGPNQPLLLLGGAERADLIVDFRNVPAGSTLILYNDAPAPFPGGDARYDYYPGNPKTPTSITAFGPNTRTLLQIRVKAASVTDPLITLPAVLTPTDPFLVPQTPGVPTPNPVGVPVRYLTLNETFDAFGRLIQLLGTNQPLIAGVEAPQFGLTYDAPVTESIPHGTTEVWEIANLTGDTHPIHFHLVNVQVLSRQRFSVKQYAGGVPNYQGAPIAPDANELGWKETVRMNPGEVTRVLMKFDLPAVPFPVPPSPRTGGNEYVWHCHILEHEEHDMMRPLVVT